MPPRALRVPGAPPQESDTMRRTIPTVLLALLCVNLAAFAAGPAQANPSVCVSYPQADCYEDSWASVDYYQTGLEICINTRVDSSLLFCPTHSQRPCPEGTEAIEAFSSRSGLLFASESRAYAFPEATSGETVTVARRDATFDTTLLARLSRATADGHCEDASGDVGGDGWVDVGQGTTFTLATFKPYEADRAVLNTYYLELVVVETQPTGRPVEYGLTRAGPALT